MTVQEILKLYGEQILKAVGFENCRIWYGPIFVQWYNETHLVRK